MILQRGDGRVVNVSCSGGRSQALAKRTAADAGSKAALNALTVKES
jgi:NAD(P)-dependent dehydrogenase (short-subunit alcohol dehydrogenase family)